jgi:4-carboxymuconolactone decarboxylase
MRSYRILIGLLLVIGTGVLAGHGLSGPPELAAASTAATSSKASAQASRGTLPKDIYPNTGNRLPAIKREDLDDAGKKIYDSSFKGSPDYFAGPRAIRLYSPPVAELMASANDYLVLKSGLDLRLQELVILVTARELDCEYVWTNHEPRGLKAGLQQGLIDIVKFRKPTSSLAEKDAVVVELGRESLGKHHVSSGTAARALNLFGKQGLVNIVSEMGDYASVGILLNVFDQHLRPTEKPLLPIP